MMRKLIALIVLFHVSCTAQANVFDLVPFEFRAQTDCLLAKDQLLGRIAAVRWHSPFSAQQYLDAPFPEWTPDWEREIWQYLIAEAYAWTNDEASWIEFEFQQCLSMGRNI